MLLRLKATSARNTAAAIMQEHLADRGIAVVRGLAPEAYDATLCWGASTQDAPSLNGAANRFNKYQAMQNFQAAGAPTPSVVLARELRPQHFVNGAVWLGRRFWHTGGRDIKPITAFGERDPQSEFFSRFIPSQTEYRVWTFRDKTLAVYEKTYKGDEPFAGIQRNHDFDFKFELRYAHQYPEALEDLSRRAVQSIELDWGATDVLLAEDGELYVLEVNSAPGIETEKRVSGIRLADQVAAWIEAGCPEREELNA